MAISVTECDRSSQNLLIILFTPHILLKVDRTMHGTCPKRIEIFKERDSKFWKVKKNVIGSELGQNMC